MTITLAQIKAARALLDWTQEQLAKASGLSLPGINNLERGLTSPRESTLTAIAQALNEGGVEFIDTTGVRMRTADYAMQTIEGGDWLARYDGEIIKALQCGEDEILQFSPDERQWMVHGSSSNHHYINHRNKVGFGERILVPKDAGFVSNKREVYRNLPGTHFGPTGYQVFTNHVALLLWPHQKIILITSAALAASYRAQFEALWQQAKPFTDEGWRKIEKWEYGSKGKKG